MSVNLFPDVAVLRRFVVAGRVDALRLLLDGRGRWTAATAFEAEQMCAGSGALDTLLSKGWLGEPLEIADPDEIQRVERLRRAVFGGAADDPLARLGEAETWLVLNEWEAYADAILITDDPMLVAHARRCGVRVQWFHGDGAIR